MAVPKKIGRARVKSYFIGDPNNIEFGHLTVDPRTGTGVPARVGSLGARPIVGDVELYQKFGPLDTQWKLLENLVSNVVTGVCFEYEIVDWASCDLGENYCLELAHNLNAQCLNIAHFEEISGGNYIEVGVQYTAVLSPNSIQLKVSQLEVDGRFSGKTSIFVK